MSLDGLTARFATFAANLRFEHVPAEAVHALKRMVMDCLGTTLAGSSLGTGVEPLLEVARWQGGPPESTVIGCGFRAPAMTAALANGGLAHTLNYDDSLGRLGLHLGVTSVPAALAVAEKTGGVSGKELLASLAAGNEVTARLGKAIYGAAKGYTETRPQTTQMLGYFNAAICAGRVLRLDHKQMHSAIGLAHMQASGGRQPVLEGCEAKALYAAFPNMGGVLSAQLAARGLGAECAAIEGDAGLFATYFPGEYDGVDDRLGEDFAVTGVTFKPWPTTAVAHVFIQAAIELAGEHDPRADDIAAVTLRGEPHVRTFCEPAEVRQAPRTSVEAEDSVPFAVAKALANRRLTLADFQPDGLSQPEARALAEKVSYQLDDTLGKSGVLQLTLNDGRQLQKKMDPLGHMSDEDLEAKFRHCASHARQPMADVDELVDLIWRLDEVPYVRELVQALSR